MEWLWMLAGAGWGAVAGYAIAAWISTRKPVHELRALQLDVEDALEKLDFRQDRARKRKAEKEEPASSLLPVDGKAALRRLARERGLLR